jgi:septal ring factor EnvC (AmiA/AmiB activator)
LENSLKKLLFSLFLLSSVAFAAVPKAPNLRQTLNHQKKELKIITKEIYSLEKSLGNGNKKYLRTLKEKESIEDSIFALQRKLKDNEQQGNDRKAKLEKSIKNLLVIKFKKNQKPGELLYLRLLRKNLKKEAVVLEKFLKDNARVRTSLTALQSKLSSVREVEMDLLNLMKDMEETKREKSLRYVEVKKLKDELQGKLKLNKAKKHVRSLVKTKTSKMIKERFLAPLAKISDMEYQKKGVTYKFDVRQNVKSSRAGKVIHTGSLSTYGNVVMVDHGNEVKSIFLGQFLPTVKKGQKLKAGASIGKTFDVAKNEGKLYFEVRKKNKAQNTILLLDRNEALKNNQSQRL